MNIVIVNCFDTYEHRVDLLHDVFLAEGHNVIVLTSNYRHFEKIKRQDAKSDFIFFNAKPYQKNLSYQRLSSHRKLSKDIFEYLNKKEDKVDLLWALIPPNSFVKDAAKFKDIHQDTKLIFDLIDLWPETMPIGSVKNLFPFSMWKNLRDKYLRYADVVVTECNLYQKKLKHILQGIRTETLYLARPLIPYEPHLTLPEDRISLCYLGSINNIIDIDVISNVIKQFMQQKPVELHIVGDGERKDILISAAENSGAEVIFHGKVYNREEKQRIFDSCHYGLNIMKGTVCVGLTMKSIDYMEYGLPLINNIHGDTWKIITENQIGFNIGDSFIVTENYDYSLRTKTRNVYKKMFCVESFDKKVRCLLDTM